MLDGKLIHGIRSRASEMVRIGINLLLQFDGGVLLSLRYFEQIFILISFICQLWLLFVALKLISRCSGWIEALLRLVIALVHHALLSL